MVCEYFLTRNGKPFCRAYGNLENSSEEKISECESSLVSCFERAKVFLEEENRINKDIEVLLS